MRRAECPACAARLIVTRDGRYPAHQRYGEGCGARGCRCEFSGWLVEDEELVA